MTSVFLLTANVGSLRSTQPWILRYRLVVAAFVLAISSPARGEQTLVPDLHHLRWGAQREWSTFPEVPEAEALEQTFDGKVNAGPWSLRLRQQDVKQTWRLLINEQQLGRLPVNENDMVVYFDVPSNTVRDGVNTLRIEQDLTRRKVSDDIRVGEIVLSPRPSRELLSEATLDIQVRQPGGLPLPCRLTVLNEQGSLQSVWAPPDPRLAVRPGVIYSATGFARFQLPAGSYTVFAGRGFEYSRPQQEIRIAGGETANLAFELRREVPTAGYVACDTHVHSLTHSGHGDATVEERMVTLAGEGIELPIATDHNVQIDHAPFAERIGVRHHFTPVIGNEVTTRVGHFNIFPVERGAPIPNYQLGNYAAILNDIFRTPGVKVAILNHARDLHSGTRPFGPRLHNAAVGENLDGWELRFNAMEVINSSATQSQPLQLLHDWMGLLNRGLRVTPVGSSDSHDVARHFVGQGRTYIRCDDGDPGRIDVEQAVANFVQGRVLVSYGLLVVLRVNDKYGSGEVAPVPDPHLRLNLEIRAPSWASAERILLLANGQLIRELDLADHAPPEQPTGILWQDQWSLAAPPHDMHLVAIAVGPGIRSLSWPTAKPYQPTSADWHPQTLACSGAVWLDVDGDGRSTAARQYAERLVNRSSGQPPAVLAALAEFDAAVAAQAAHLLQSRGGNLLSPDWQDALKSAAPQTQAGFRQYLSAWRESQRSRTP